MVDDGERILRLRRPRKYEIEDALRMVELDDRRGRRKTCLPTWRTWRVQKQDSSGSTELHYAVENQVVPCSLCNALFALEDCVTVVKERRSSRVKVAVVNPIWDKLNNLTSWQNWDRLRVLILSEQRWYDVRVRKDWVSSANKIVLKKERKERLVAVVRPIMGNMRKPYAEKEPRDSPWD